MFWCVAGKKGEHVDWTHAMHSGSSRRMHCLPFWDREFLLLVTHKVSSRSLVCRRRSSWPQQSRTVAIYSAGTAGPACVHGLSTSPVRSGETREMEGKRARGDMVENVPFGGLWVLYVRTELRRVRTPSVPPSENSIESKSLSDPIQKNHVLPYLPRNGVVASQLVRRRSLLVRSCRLINAPSTSAPPMPTAQAPPPAICCTRRSINRRLPGCRRCETRSTAGRRRRVRRRPERAWPRRPRKQILLQNRVLPTAQRPAGASGCARPVPRRAPCDRGSGAGRRCDVSV